VSTRLTLRAAALAAAFLLGTAALAADAPATAGYHHAPPAIARILAAAPTPGVLVSRDHRTLAILGRENLPTIANLSKPILRLAGFRIDPATNGPAEVRVQWLNALSFKDLATGATVAVRLPAGARFMTPSWSPDGQRLAFVMQEPAGLALWVADRSGAARPLVRGVNAAFGNTFEWAPDSRSLLVRTILAERGAPPVRRSTPAGPIVQESRGRTSAARTYEDLLADSVDEQLFDYYFSGRLARVDLAGTATPLGEPGLYSDFSLSPDGRYILVERLKRPFSYLLPAGFFPTEIAIWTADGRPVRTLVDRPLADDLPVDFDAVVKGPREAEWRADSPATLVWAEALDGGDPKAKVPHHDRLLMQAAAFDAPPVELARTARRYAGTFWGDDGFAMVLDRQWKTRTEGRYAVAPAHPGEPRLLATRNYQDQYGDPGRPILEANPAGKPVMRFTPDHAAVFVTGEGATAAGAFPFLATLPTAGGPQQRLWTATAPYYEEVVALLDDKGGKLLTRRESALLAPNYYVRTVVPKGAAKAVTSFPDPAPELAHATKRTITYARADGLKLSGTLYLPAGYDPKKDGPLPTLLWAYPAEFTDPRVAGQTVDQGNRFTRPRGISHLFLLTQGYAILDNPAMPIVGENGAEPNDTYVKQLQADAQAAVDAVVAMGVGDRDRMAVGGHSYGAFMTANLLAHTSLFRAGIARSGAYNRTLTPFGFQAEQRTYWQAVPTYTEMSPFTFADRIKAPILLIHGGADDNSGTFPIQSERFYAALKGNGGTVRYVVLPNEPHGYRGMESTEETLWQMTDWLDRWVKPKRGDGQTTAPAAH
jgi:dipeptidyl aminopeptidase/acylaminoacyl peptidase